MAQNIYDDEGFFAGYSGLDRSVHGLAGAAEWPVLRSMLPDVNGLRVVDLGCGYGWFCRWAREQGAKEVLGLDISEKMLDRARGATTDRAVAYRRADLEELSLPPASFDLVYSSLAFHYVEDAERLYRTIHAALAAGGRLVFSTEHPIFMASMKPGWLEAEDGKQIWRLDSYAREGERRTDWFSKGVLKYHRTMATTLNQLVSAGFTIRRIEEFRPSDAQIAQMPALAAEIERPTFLIVAADA